MPKGTRRIPVVEKTAKGNAYITTPARPGKKAHRRDMDFSSQDVRSVIGDKNVAKLKSLPDDSRVDSTGKATVTKAGQAEYTKKRRMAEKAKATVDKAGKDAIDLVRRKKSTYRDDYKE